MIWRWIRSKSEYGWTFLDQVVVSGSYFVIGILAARFLGREMFGEYSLILLIVMLFEAVQRSVVATPMLTLAQHKTEEEQQAYFLKVYYLQIIIALLLVPIVASMVYASGQIFPQWHIKEYYFATALFAATRSLQEFARRHAFAVHKPSRAIVLDLIAYTTFTFVLFLLYTTGRLALSSILLVGTFSFLLSSFAGQKVFSRRHNTPGTFAHLWHTHWRFGKWLAATQVCQWFSGNYLVLVMGAIINPIEAGGIRAVLTLLGPLTILFLTMENIVPVRAATAYHRTGMRGFLRYLALATLVATVFAGGILLILAVPADYCLATLFGSEYARYAPELRGMALVTAFSPLSLGLLYGLRTLHQTHTIFIANLVNALLSIALGPLFIRHYHTIGYVYGVYLFMLINLVINAGCFFYYIRRAVND